MGFQLTFFRSRIVPPKEGSDERSVVKPDERTDEKKSNKNTSAVPASAWRTDHIILGHAALSDLSSGRFYHSREVARDAIGMAGIETVQGRTVVSLKKWSAEIGPHGHRLLADTGEFEIDLHLTPQKPPVLHGDQGYSRKGTGPDRASCYYSFTRLSAEGIVTVAETAFPVEGAAWMDHEFSTAPLEKSLSGWDWLSLQLSDGTEVMIYLLRRPDGSFHPASSGTFVDREGGSRHLAMADVGIKSVATWKSPHSGAVYPSRWQIDIAPLSLRLDIASAMPDQEMTDGGGASSVIYWEGSVSVSGRRAGVPLTGAGYAELTGYAGPLDVLK